MKYEVEVFNKNGFVKRIYTNCMEDAEILYEHYTSKENFKTVSILEQGILKIIYKRF